MKTKKFDLSLGEAFHALTQGRKVHYEDWAEGEYVMHSPTSGVVDERGKKCNAKIFLFNSGDAWAIYEEPKLYEPQFLSWCKSYEQEVDEFRELISSMPSDIKQLKAEFRELTGKQFKKETQK